MKKLHRFIINRDLEKDTFMIHDAEIIFQLHNVLHLQVGESFILCDGNGTDAVVRLKEIVRGGLLVDVLETTPSISESQNQVTLFCAVLKGDHFEWVAQKCTEVGVHQIIPIITHRTIKLNLRHDRIQKIMQEAAEQSGRGMVPALGEALSFAEALPLIKNYQQNFFLDIGAGSAHLSTLVGPNLTSSSLWIGPEGGWEEREQAEALEAGCTLAHLGQFILRAETAALLGTALLSTEAVGE